MLQDQQIGSLTKHFLEIFFFIHLVSIFGREESFRLAGVFNLRMVKRNDGIRNQDMEATFYLHFIHGSRPDPRR